MPRLPVIKHVLLASLVWLAFCPLFAVNAEAGKSFQGYACTKDCSGHKAGYAWAMKKSIHDPGACTGRSKSFVEGCRAWAVQHPPKNK